MFCLCAAAMNMVLPFRWAKKEGITPQEVIDKYDGIIRKFIDFDISFDNYSRTSAKIHHDTAQSFFSTLYEKVIL
jgi:methionyl-tRNA synthetase